MARVGFQKDYASGAFDQAAVLALFDQIKTTLADAGFTVIASTATSIAVLRAGFPAGTADDDVAHWAFDIVDNASDKRIRAHAIHGVDLNDANAQIATYEALRRFYWGTPSTPGRVLFAADGVAGWWWLVALHVDEGSASGWAISQATVGVSSRRYASDTHSGLCARYGLWSQDGDYYIPYCLDDSGAPSAGAWAGSWSVFGEGWSYNSKRHVGSTLPRLAVPVFPNRDGTGAACVQGEFNEVLALTDGYAQGEAPIPGWIAIVGNEQQPFALPSPMSFTVL